MVGRPGKRLIGVLALSSSMAWGATNPVNSLGWQVLRAQPPGNALISPYSISSVLAMVYAGSAGTTRQQMESSLGFGADTLPFFHQVRTEMLVGETGDDADQPEQIVLLADAVFGQRGYPFLSDYLAQLEQTFSSPLEEVDFENHPAKATREINDWVEERTRDKIEDLIPEDAVTDLTRLVLVNAVYFRSPWAAPFSDNGNMTFGARGPSPSGVPSMRIEESLGYLRTADYELVTVPYLHGEFLFCAWLPVDGAQPLGELGSTLDAAAITAAVGAPRRLVDLTLPKFALRPPLLALSPTLKNLGIPSVFDVPRGSADFSRMAMRRPDDYLYVSEVFHRTFIDVNENGTEAAAATAAVMMRATALPVDPPVRVIFDRPFLFAIVDRRNATCLFLGRVVSPAPASPPVPAPPSPSP